MRFTGISDRGYSLTAVCGPEFDYHAAGILSEVPLRRDPVAAAAAIRAVQRARAVSYIERGILPKTALRNPSRLSGGRDESCVHLIIHRHNCLLGTIRNQFHWKHPSPADAVPLYQEIIQRNQIPDSACQAVLRQLEETHQESASLIETSGWLANSDFPRSPVVSMAVISASWALGAMVPPMPGISALRTSNGAARTLQRLGSIPVRHEGADLIIEDSFYRGSVRLMVNHSRRYSMEIDSFVKECSLFLKRDGFITF
ncbi:MAG: hypothetical protein JWM59_3720 [Verrucomicrobiales bacterium]|nr:hypothetical protein [Verrucomicrobiales bacterium]